MRQAVTILPVVGVAVVLIAAAGLAVLVIGGLARGGRLLRSLRRPDPLPALRAAAGG